MLTAAILVLLLHLFWMGFIIFGALFTRGRPFWTTVHVVGLLWGIIAESGLLPCPLTIAEVYFETGAGIAPFQHSFLARALDAVVYPNVPGWLISVMGVSICAFNLGIYLWRLRKYHLLRRARSANRAS